jgi:nuclear migration protein JNM1
LKFEIGKLRENSSGGNNASIEDITDDSLNQLSSAIEVLDGVGFGGQQSAERRLAQKLSSITKFTSSDSNGTTSHATTGKAERTQDGSSYTVSYVPSFQQNHILAKAADFDKRLVLLEEVLGLDNMLLPSQGTSSVKAVLPTLDTLDRQVAFLTSTSASSLDPIGKRIRQLTQEAEKLDEARRSAKASQEALKSSQSETFTHPDRANDTRKGDDGDDTEDISKINSLYGILPSIESLAPLLPSVLDRLRSLRLIHADAAGASHTLANVEKRQAEMVADIKSWRAGLEKVEGVMRDSEVTMASNMKMIEGWVQELEGRVKSLG